MNSRIAVAGAATASMFALMGLMSRPADAEPNPALEVVPPEQATGRQIVYVYQSVPGADVATQILQPQVAATPSPRIIQANPRQVTATRSSGSR